MKYYFTTVFFIVMNIAAMPAQAKEVTYQLTIDTKDVNFSGNQVQAMAINNSIPGPVLEFTEGDVAVINVTNKTKDEASIHWHGLLLPQEQDGVPYLTMFPIESGETFQYRFELKHAGTYWYHSHTRIDEQRGQYGAIIVHPKNGYEENFQHDVVVQLSDWTDEDPLDVLKNLKKNGEWYAYKKDSVISLKGYLENSDLDAWLTNRWQRMEGMDVSDVGYDAFLANGQKLLNIAPDAKSGDKIRVRLINSGASSIFDIQQHQGTFEIVAADGIDVQPVSVKEFRMAMAETYDFIITIPSSGAIEFAANNIDGTGGVKVKVGSGKANAAPTPVKPNLFVKMNHANHKEHQKMNSDTKSNEHQHMHHNMVNSNINGIEPMLDYDMLKVRKPVDYQGELQEFTLKLTGDMESYNWSFNNLPLSEADVIKIDRGKVVRFHFYNKTMMNHPLHLHGHFFKVISGNGEYDVLKHTVNVKPMSSVTIEFAANEYKDWFFHCHNLYHAKTGMARIVRYSDYQGNKDFNKAKMLSNEIMDTDWYKRTDIEVLSNHAAAQFRLSNFNHIFQFESEHHFDQSESEFIAHYNYRKSRWLQYYIGLEREDDENEFVLGVKYVTPFSIESMLWLNQDGQLHIEAETEFQLTERFGLEIGASSESEWEASLEYRNSPYWSIKLNTNEISKLGLGVTATF